MKTWVDTAYAVNRDMKSHTGGVAYFGTGAALSKSTKQKLNTKSSAEAELVDASNYLPHAIWAKNFWKHRVTCSPKTNSSRITKAQLGLRRTAGARVDPTRGT